MKRNHTSSLVYLALLFTLSISLASCKPSQEATDAMTAAGNVGETRPILYSSGAIVGMRRAMPESFPKVLDLMQQDSNARTAMLNRFLTGGMYEDLELSIYAYAFEQLGDKSAVFPLKQFIRRSFDGPFLWAPHFATHAVLSITGKLDTATDTNWYTVEERLAVVQGGSPAELSSLQSAAFVEPAVQTSAARKKSKSCTRNYMFIDANDQPILRSDGKKAVLWGTIQSCPELPQEDITEYNNRVANGGGTRVGYGEFGSEPTRQFNCGGYAMRNINVYDGDAHKWNVDPNAAYDVLTKANLATRIDNASLFESYAVGDIVFYFKSGGTSAEHVAEIYNPGLGGKTLYLATVWNADQISGMFQCGATASYFDTAAGGLPDRRVYRWIAGQPRVKPDPDAKKPGNCLVTPVIDGDCEEPPAPVLKRDNSCPANGSLCQWCGGLETASIWDTYAMIAWSAETKLDQLDYESTNLNTNEKIEWGLTFSGGQPNATLTVTHNKITGKGGSGRYRFADGTQSDITSADIDLNFAGWSMTGTIVAHTANGKQATVEVKNAHCEGTYP